MLDRGVGSAKLRCNTEIKSQSSPTGACGFGIADPARSKATTLPKAAHLWSLRPRLRPDLRLSGPSSPQGS